MDKKNGVSSRPAICSPPLLGIPGERQNITWSNIFGNTLMIDFLASMLLVFTTERVLSYVTPFETLPGLLRMASHRQT